MSEVINIKELNERIERESVFVDTLRQEMGKVIVGQSHLVDTLLTKVRETFFFHVTVGSEDVHHDRHLHRQFEQHSAHSSVAAIHDRLHRRDHIVRQHPRTVIRPKVTDVCLNGFFNKFRLTSAVIVFVHFFYRFHCFGCHPKRKLDFLVVFHNNSPFLL